MSKNAFLRIFSPTGCRIFKKIFLPERPSQDAQKSVLHLCRCDTPFGRYSQISVCSAFKLDVASLKIQFFLGTRVVFNKTHYVPFFLKNHLVQPCQGVPRVVVNYKSRKRVEQRKTGPKRGTHGGFFEVWMSLCRESVAHVKSFHQTCQTSKLDHKRLRYALKVPKIAKIGSDDLTLRNCSSVVYDHVFRLKYVLEPSRPQEYCPQKSASQHKVGLSKIFENVKI